jgi:hypothetical protein
VPLLLGFPKRVRWWLARKPGLLNEVLRLFLQVVAGWQRRRARGMGVHRGQTGAVTFVQYFNSALLLHPHFHAVVPEGVWAEGEKGVSFHELPPPSTQEVERLLA